MYVKYSTGTKYGDWMNSYLYWINWFNGKYLIYKDLDESKHGTKVVKHTTNIFRIKRVLIFYAVVFINNNRWFNQTLSGTALSSATYWYDMVQYKYMCTIIIM